MEGGALFFDEEESSTHSPIGEGLLEVGREEGREGGRICLEVVTVVAAAAAAASGARAGGPVVVSVFMALTDRGGPAGRACWR